MLLNLILCSFLSHLCGECAFRFPAHMEPGTYGSVWYAEPFAKGGQAVRYSENGYYPGIPLVSLLLLSSSPTAIVFAVTEIVIFPVQRKPFRTLTHIGKEVLELEPVLVHADASASVLWKSSVIGVCASLNHAPPRGVRLGRPAPAQVAVCRSSAVFVTPEASARVGRATAQEPCLNDMLVSAFADANGFLPFKHHAMRKAYDC